MPRRAGQVAKQQNTVDTVTGSDPSEGLEYRLRLPGPTAVPRHVAQATAMPVVNHRGPEFRALMTEAEALLQPVFGTKNRILFFASSGTGMMEASLANTLQVGERVLVLNSGQFAERFAEIAKALGARVDTVECPWGESPDLAEIKTRLSGADYRAVIAVHNESSTGSVAELAAVGALVRDTPALLIVDSVSGLGGVEMQQDAWGVDIVISASHKALMCPPGIGLASVSEKAWPIVMREASFPRFYWDFRKAVKNSENFETPFTPPVSLMNGLLTSLRSIHEEGLKNVLTRHRVLADTLIAGGEAMGLKLFTHGRLRSNTVVVFEVPEGISGGDVVRGLYDDYRTVVAGARNRLSGRVVRIGVMGDVDHETILTDLAHLEAVLRKLGHNVPVGAGVAAAQGYRDA